MSLIFYALDNEFAAATGNNVNSGFNTSTFDNPPQGSKDLIITAHDDDTDPRHFELGDTYDVSFGGIGGGTILNAVVVRSDAAPGGGGIIVLEGVDDNGDLTQVIWTPGFDLEGWYAAHYNPSAEPGFYVADQQAPYDHTFVCFAADTRIATAMGGVAAGDLWQGDHLATLDDGPQPVVWIGERTVTGHGSNAPVLFSPGSIGNHAPLRLSQQHRVLIRSPMAEMMFGSSEVLVPAKALVNGETIRIMPCSQIAYVHVLLARHQVIMAEGAPCESLLLGDMARDLVALGRGAYGCDATPVRPILRYGEAIAALGVPPPLALRRPSPALTVI